MVQTAQSTDTQQALKSKIIAVYEYLSQQQDFINAEKIKQLAMKLENQEFLIAFCGHFSAGKSTMINQVIGEDLLPSSPIPTSANLVKVRAGEEYAKVFFKNEKPRLYLAPYDYELVKNYCKDGDKIKEIEISHLESHLPKNTVIMDTPGIDSADDAHRVATESAIHLANLVFYVMDYNHVQAELNFLFTKELTEAGKDVYLVINQIDKHNDEELSFQDFQNSVLDSFASWGVKPARIFYTSLKDRNHRFNEFNELQEFIFKKLALKEQLLLPSIFHSLKKIAQDHLYHSQKAAEEEQQMNIKILSEFSVEGKKELTPSFTRVSKSIKTIMNKVEMTKKDFDEEITQIMKNAYLMPFQTRAVAKEYLESCQPEFKVGFLFGKQKTEVEKSARLERFYQEILEKSKSQLEWHLREFLLSVIEKNELDQVDLLQKAQSFSIDIPIELLKNTVKSGARLSGEYVLHYTEDVVNEIKKIAQGMVADFERLFVKSLKEKMAYLKEQAEKELSRLNPYINALAELKKQEDKNKLKEKELDEILTKEKMIQKDIYQLFTQEEEEFEVIKDFGNGDALDDDHILPEIEEISTSPRNDDKNLQQENGHLRRMVERLQKTSQLIRDLPGFQKLAMDLEEKAGRLAGKGYTVALFGAFSAGKSSFANALMGEKVLPVSPNPTTAAINKIKPVTTTFPHGTVLVKFKEETALLDDVNRSLKVFDLQAGNFDEALRKIEQITLQENQQGVLERTHFAFLTAFTDGHETYGKLLGTVLGTDLASFTEFVTKEEKSCYVEWIELYYDCELTRKGITLVDTPGADSINARHTGVAFDYIKNSDAILFVTYYNHAFSKADREFVIQLGRVKDSFQMDKMFFLINAIDLAENEEEKATVAAYVKEQLSKYGIRNPHLYSLSSHFALQEKMGTSAGDQSGMHDFEQGFNQFITNDLTYMAITAAGNEVNRIQDLVAKLIYTSMEDETVKEQNRIDIEKQKKLVKGVIDKQTMENLETRLRQEAEELVYYLKQRVFLRFGDFFKESFNPSTLRDEGRNLKKSLQAALDEFLESLGFDFAQEMRATTIRLDRFAEKVIAEYQTGLIRNLQEINGDLSFSVFEIKQEEEIDFQSAFKNIDKQIFSKALSHFKNPKSFFEKNEKKLMSDELTNVLNELTDIYLSEELSRLNHYYATGLTKEFNRLLKQVYEQTDDFYLSLLSTLDGGISIEVLEGIQQKLAE
jgi:GTPase Era involved in 16S rRNA processing